MKYIFKNTLLTFVFTLFVYPAILTAKVFNVLDYGASADGRTLDTEAVQSAINACTKAGGGTVLIPTGKTVLIGTVLLKDHVTLHVEKNATLLGSENPLDYQSIDTFVDATGQERGKCLVGALDAQGVGIV